MPAMWSFLSKMGPQDPKMPPLMKGGFHTAPLTFLGNCAPLGPIIHDKQFPSFMNRSNLGTRGLQMDRPVQNSSPVNPEPYTSNQGCSKKKKKKRRRKKKKKNQQICQQPSGGCQRQRHLSTESEDSFVIFFDEALTTDRISEVSEDSDSVVSHKKVRFADDSELCEVHPMVMWAYAYQAARKGPWEEYARDRDRFQQRVKNVEADIGHVFEPEHRAKIYRERFT